MSDLRIWKPVIDAFAQWAKVGLKPPLWLRDDDAIEPSPALDRLMALAAQHEVPIALAIVPATTGATLVERLRREPHVTPIVHGWAHVNHAPENEKRQEFGLHRPLADIQADLVRALSKMKSLYGPRLVPMFVPPWNRITTSVAESLVESGYEACSTFGHAPLNSSICEINTHVDIVDFRGGRRCRDHGLLAGSLASTLSHSLEGGRYPVGILSHHLVHDDAAFEFLKALFSISRTCRWLSPRELVERCAGLV
jgi:hypothetical protein